MDSSDHSSNSQHNATSSPGGPQHQHQQQQHSSHSGASPAAGGGGGEGVKLGQLLRPPAMVVMSDVTCYALNERALAAESCLFVTKVRARTITNDSLLFQ